MLIAKEKKYTIYANREICGLRLCTRHCNNLHLSFANLKYFAPLKDSTKARNIHF